MKTATSCDLLASRYLQHEIKDFYNFKLFHSFEVAHMHIDPSIVSLEHWTTVPLVQHSRARFEKREERR